MQIVLTTYASSQRDLINQKKLKNIRRQPRFQLFQKQSPLYQIIFLKLNYFKTFIAIILLTVSIIGLFFLKYFIKFRVFCFFDKTQGINSTFVYLRSQNQMQQICQIKTSIIKKQTYYWFIFYGLRYFVNKQLKLCFPIALNLQQQIQNIFVTPFKQKGLSQNDVRERQNYFGQNKHQIYIPWYFQYLFDTMTKPFYIFQYIVSAVYIIQGSSVYGFLMLGFSFLTATINYILLRISYLKIKQTAQKEIDINVIRNGVQVEIKNYNLIPGDIFKPKDQIPCDCLIIQGQMSVDQSTLTGQNIPINKIQIKNQYTNIQNQNWLYEGSKILSMKDNVYLLAIDVGFSSKKGRIIRKIIHRVTVQPQFLYKLIYFLVEISILIMIAFAAHLKFLLSLDIQSIMIFIRFCDFITYCFPAAFPIFFNIVFSFSLIRLKRINIYGTQQSKTVEGSRLKTICFDKTGTLTEQKMQIASIINFESIQQFYELKYQFIDEQIQMIFGCCNSVQVINNEIKGDEIDLRMFQKSNSKLQYINGKRIIGLKNKKYQIIKINPYQSKFQSMSVLVRQQNQQKAIVLCKGSPQLLYRYSILKPSYFQDLINKSSLQGLRSIAFSYKYIDIKDIQRYQNLKRQQYLSQTKLKGIVQFSNILKEDATSTLSQLRQNGISIKMITGDNIFLAIKAAYSGGIFSSMSKVIAVQGRRFQENQKSVALVVLKIEQNKVVSKIQYFQQWKFDEQQQEIFYAVDNDYLQNHKDCVINKNIKVFARSTPETKALIIRQHCIYQKSIVNNRSLFQKITGQCSYRVGMVGDGANDLAAMKQADISISIMGKDAVYSASFAVINLSQIRQIIAQAKSNQRSIIEMVQYFLLAQVIVVTTVIIGTFDSTKQTSMQLIYKNFFVILAITPILGLNIRQDKLTSFFPQSNFMGLQNHLVYWGNSFFCVLGISITYYYYFLSKDFIGNPTSKITYQNGWNGQNKTTTMVFLIGIPYYILTSLSLYRSKPWKKPFYYNIVYLILIIVNIIMILVINFTTEKHSWLNLVKINTKQAGLTLLMTFIFNLIIYLYNQLIAKKCNNIKQQNLQLVQQ